MAAAAWAEERQELLRQVKLLEKQTGQLRSEGAQKAKEVASLKRLVATLKTTADDCAMER